MEDNNTAQMPLGIYIHIPFCIKKCDYCDFLSGSAEPEIRQAYLEALLGEIRMNRNLHIIGSRDKEREDAQKQEQYQEKEWEADFLVRSVFFGGGTPSILSGQAVGEILAALRERFSFDSDAEISLEANPGTVTEEKLALWKEAGVNRLSFGLQSADNRELTLLGRIHTFEQFLESWELAAKAGYGNRNIDLMSALPGQTVESWERTLKTVAALKPEHLSAYSLIIEEGTPFYQRFADPECPDFALLPDEEAEREMYWLTCRELKKYGYQRYEISNYALPGFACRHNCGYWEGVRYLGFGVGAASYIMEETAQTMEICETGAMGNPELKTAAETYIRLRNVADTAEYIRRMKLGLSPVEERLELTAKNRMEEFMFLGLRMKKGISFQDFRRRFGCSFDQIYREVTEKLKGQGLVTETETGIYLTDYGIDVSNYVFGAYLLS